MVCKGKCYKFKANALPKRGGKGGKEHRYANNQMFCKDCDIWTVEYYLSKDKTIKRCKCCGRQLRMRCRNSRQRHSNENNKIKNGCQQNSLVEVNPIAI